jgi:hypothetical protein
MRFAVSPFDFALLMLIAITALAIGAGSAPFMHDFAEWLYQGQVVKGLLGGEPSMAGFAVAAYPVPNALATLILAALSFVFPALWAGKIYLILMLIGWYWVLRLFTKRYLAPELRAPAAPVLYVLTAFSTFFWYGFISYQLGLLLLTLYCAVYRSNTHASVIAVFGLLLFFSHAMVFLVFALFMGLLLILERKSSILVGLLPAAACSVWFLAGRHLAGVEPQPVDASWASLWEALIYKAGYPAMLGPFKNFLMPGGVSLLEGLPWLYWTGLIANFALIALLGISMTAIVWTHAIRRRVAYSGHAQTGVALSASTVLIIIAYWLAPYHFFGLINPGGRLLIPLILMALMLAGHSGIPLLRFMAWPTALIALLTSGAYLFLMIQTQARGFSSLPAPAAPLAPSASVFEFNDRLYSNTRYRYFNYRLFLFAHRFEQMESGIYPDLAFRTGLLIEKKP